MERENEQLQQTVERRQRRIEELEDEVARLKGLPEKPKRSKPQPSALTDTDRPPSASGKKKRKKSGGKRPGSAKRSKTRQIPIHETVPLPLEGLPEGTRFIGHQEFTVQDLRVEVHNTRYRRRRYQMGHSARLGCRMTSRRISARL